MEEKAQFFHAPSIILIGAYVFALAVNYNESFISNRSIVMNVFITLAFSFVWLCFSISEKTSYLNLRGLALSALAFISLGASLVFSHLGIVVSSFVPYVIVYSLVTPFYEISSITNGNWNTYYGFILCVSIMVCIYKFINRHISHNQA